MLRPARVGQKQSTAWGWRTQPLCSSRPKLEFTFRYFGLRRGRAGFSVIRNRVWRFVGIQVSLVVPERIHETFGFGTVIGIAGLVHTGLDLLFLQKAQITEQ